MNQLEQAFQKHFAAAGRSPAASAVRRAAFVPELRAIDEQKRTIEFVASTESVDRYKDVLKVSGWQTANYMKNPVVLWAHNSHEPPIGKTLSIRTEANPAALVQLVEFASKETYAFADQIFQLYRQKFLNSVSVGFRPLAPPEMIIDADGKATGGYEFTSMELLELSCVPIPANTDAVARAIDGGIISAADAAKIFVAEESDLREEFEARLSALETEFSAFKRDMERTKRGASVETLADLEVALRG